MKKTTNQASYSKMQYEIEKSLTATIDKKFRSMKLDVNNIILGMSNQGHSRNISNISSQMWKSFDSDNQTITSIGSALQKALLRNL